MMAISILRELKNFISAKVSLPPISATPTVDSVATKPSSTGTESYVLDRNYHGSSVRLSSICLSSIPTDSFTA